MKVNFEVHETHIPLWENKNWRYAFLMGGRANGRSGTASRFTVSQLLSKEYMRGVAMRAVHSDIDASCWTDITDRIIEQDIESKFDITDKEIVCGNNSIRKLGFKSSSGSLTARLKSLANYNYVWIEEAEEVGEEEFRKLDDSLRTTQGRIRIVFTLNTPSKTHWIIKKFFDCIPHPDAKGFYTIQLKPEHQKDAIYIGGTFRENEIHLDKHTIDRYQEYKYTQPAYYWQVIEGLAPDEVRGKIYTGWQLVDEIPEDAKLLSFGVDWGWYPDPVAVVACYYFNGGYYFDEVVVGNNISDEEVARAIKQIKGYERVTAFCGADEPKSIEMLKKYRVRADRAVSGAGAVDFRIKTLSARKIFVTRRSDNIWDSYENYRWAEDKDGNPKNEPDHFKSDPMDACGYAMSNVNPAKEYMIKKPRIPKKKTNIAM